MRSYSGMRVRFLLGPAGSGKTFRCLGEIRAALRRNPSGPPLVFLAPKQATYQLERQLLADDTLAGYSRLRILSFERLAAFIFEQARQPLPDLLDEEGRVMVLRALLTSRQSDLKAFRSSARWPGFARQLSGLLREMQQHHVTPSKLAKLTGRVGSLNRLDHKLHDLGLLLQAYLDWLDAHRLQDGDRWLDLAADALRGRNGPFQTNWIEGLWLDGFAQMTPQERSLLAALVGHCDRATLAFCLEHEPPPDIAWYSQWALLARTYHQCRCDLAALPDCEMDIETLPRNPVRHRFQGSPLLQHLERHWANPAPFPHAADVAEPGPDASIGRCLRIVQCPEPETEAIAAAREILAHVRAGGRFRETAIHVRSLEPYHAVIRRVFARYEIPFFIDRRESVSHHPMVELTRNALRTVTFGWKHDDWFGALKSGLVSRDDGDIDWLENEALAHGWEGRVWPTGFGADETSHAGQVAERLRATLTRPFLKLAQDLGSTPTGRELTNALQTFWKTWRIRDTLQSWSRGAAADHAAPPRDSHPHAETGSIQPLHETVWEQMQLWADNVARAFPSEALSLPEWLPILEAGLSGLTVGVVPPVLDQVLVGAIDRSRNPDLKLAIALGWNETIFPAPPPAPLLLTESDRQRLEDAGHALGSGSKIHLGHERFYGYIACTRARERLVLTYAQRDAAGAVLNPSPFLRHIQQLVPGFPEEAFSGTIDWSSAIHASELIAPILQSRAGNGSSAKSLAARLETHPALAPVLGRWRHWQTPAGPEALSPSLADRLYGRRFVTSVSRIEDFAACPFRFFVRSGLQVEERARFELDIRQQGSFQHDVLAEFHRRLAEAKKPWRQLTPEEARTLIGQIADDLTPHFQNGMLLATGRNRFLARSYKSSLQQFIAVILGWMNQYQFDPDAVEIGFGMDNDDGTPGWPAWELPLDDDRKLAFIGRIDRVDLYRDPEQSRTFCVVIDYKSGQRKVDRVLMEHGIQQQLPAYLNVLRHLRQPGVPFGDSPLVPSGVFYVPLRGRFEGGSNRRDVLQDLDQAQRFAYTHQGFADLNVRRWLDNRPGANQGDQFPYKLTKDNLPYKGNPTLLPTEEFIALLDRQRQWLIEAGRRIFAGDVAIDPWKRGVETACGRCEFRSVCRIDPWTHAYRSLSS